tara:strand:+ start:652 stop:1020 length:369 start_codon:yes stop_codon:yes gene_type:complete
MALKLKMFDTLGMVTLVTPPSMMNSEKTSFTLVNLKEKEKNHFAVQLNKLFPDDNVTVYIYDTVGNNGWLKQAMDKSKFVIADKKNTPIWIEEMMPQGRCHMISEERTLEQTFEEIQKGLEK